MSVVVEVALAVAHSHGRLLVGRRVPGVHLAGLWEFPGGKIDEGELPMDAAARELLEETGLVARSIQPLVIVAHDYGDRPVRLHAFMADELEGEPAEGWSWKTLAELRELEMPAANGPILNAIRWRIG
jgi:8-oxo-dGTP diphosphatase